MHYPRNNNQPKWRLVWNLPRLLKKTWSLLINPRVANKRKLIFLFLTLGYLFWPFDLIPDIPFVGQLDDLGIIFLLMNWFIRKKPDLDPDVIEAEYYYIDDQQNNSGKKDSP